MAKDTEKLIRQLSLISYLMAERRPVTALEIRRDVEGYSGMNEDAFARRFYADRAELDSLGIHLTVDKPADGVAEQENYSLRPENFHLPAIAFTDEELAALQSALTPARRRVRLRRAAAPRAAADLLGPPEPAAGARAALGSRSASPAAPAGTSSPSAWPRSRPRSSAARRSRSTTTRWSATSSARARSTRTTCCSRAASSTSSATRTSATRCACSGSRGSAARSPTRPRPSTTSSAPTDFDPREYASRADWQFGDADRQRRGVVSDRIAWQVERHFGRFGELRRRREDGVLFSHAVRERAPARLVGARPRASTRASRARRSSSTSRGRARRRCWSSGTSREPLLAAAVASAPRRGAPRSPPPRPTGAREAAHPPRALRAPGHARLDPDRGRPRAASACATRSRVRAPADHRGRAARGRQRAQRRQLRRRLLRALRRGARRRQDRGRPRALLRQLRPPGAAAAGRGQGAGRGDRPDRRAPPRGRADQRAREDRRRARRRPDGAGPAGRHGRRRRLRHRARRLARRSSPAACSRSSTTRRTRTSSPSAPSSPTR